MTGLNFPTSPGIRDTYTLGTRTWIWNGAGWQIESGILSTSPFTVISEVITTTTNSTGTTSGALIVGGGAGFAGDIYANTIYSNNAVVVTTATIGAIAGIVLSVSAGTDTSVSTTTGAVLIWTTSTLASVTKRGSTTSNRITITNTTPATSTQSGALIISGGIGIGGDVYIGGSLYVNNQTVLTTSTLGGYFTGGVDISISSTGTGTLVINDVSTLQSVTSRGSATSNAIIVNNTNISTSTLTGAVIVSGGVGIGGDLNIAGSLTVTRHICNPAPQTVNISTAVLDSFSTSTYRSVKYFVSVSNPGLNVYQTSEIWLVQDGSNARIEETTVYSSGMNLVEFDAVVAGGVVSLTATGSITGNVVKIQGTYIIT